MGTKVRKYDVRKLSAKAWVTRSAYGEAGREGGGRQGHRRRGSCSVKSAFQTWCVHITGSTLTGCAPTCLVEYAAGSWCHQRACGACPVVGSRQSAQGL